jgi:uncharacterized protein involved in exopolysaccharide biosynthesis
MNVPHHTPARSSVGPIISMPADWEQRVSLLRVASVIMRHRGLVLGLALLGFAGTVLVLLTRDRTYTTMSSFMPQNRSSQAALSGVAAQFGVMIAGVEPGRSPAFYADLIRSRQILGAVVDTPFPLGPGTRKVLLTDVYHSSGDTPALRRDAAMLGLSSNLSTRVDQGTGVVKLMATATDPRLALLINGRILDLLNDFNLHSRQSQAAAERRFVESRLEEMRKELREAEDRQQAFLQRNRDFQNSPELTFQQDRLRREVTMRQQLFNSLAEAYEKAKIDEVRDTPVITAVERPELPVRPDRRGLVKWGATALVAGFLLGAGLAWLIEALKRSRVEEPDEYAEFEELRRRSTADLSHAWRRVFGGWRRAPSKQRG